MSFPAYLKFMSANSAIDGVCVMIVRGAMGTHLGGNFSRGYPRNFGGHNSGGYGDDPVAEDHDYRCDGLTQTCFRGNITITDSGQGNDSPVYAAGDIGKTILLPFDHVHEGSEYHDHGEHGKKKNSDLAPAGLQGPDKHFCFVEILNQFQDAEDPQYAHQSQNQEILASRNQKAEISGQNRQQINDPVKAQGITDTFPYADETENIFDRKKHRKKPLGPKEQRTVILLYIGDAVQHHSHNAEQDAEDQTDIEDLTGPGIGLKNYLVQAVPPWAEGFFLHFFPALSGLPEAVFNGAN
jgi:hypothetical protein